MKAKHKYRRVLLKLSGETLLGGQSFGIGQMGCKEVASYLARFQRSGIELGVVIGGGNIFRGVDLRQMGIARTPADHMGMLATLFNAIAIEQALAMEGVPASVMSAFECPKMAETYQWNQACKYLSEGRVVLFAGGTGNPYFTTDTVAALRASEIEAEVLMKATKVDGIYDRDPLKYSDAKKYENLSYSQMLAEKLQVMDATAVAICRGSQIPIFVFNMKRLATESIESIIGDDTLAGLGTWVRGE